MISNTDLYRMEWTCGMLSNLVINIIKQNKQALKNECKKSSSILP